MKLVVIFHGRGRIVKGSTPALDLILAIDFDGFLFVFSHYEMDDGVRVD